MKKETKSTIKSNAVTGASATVGAAIGMSIGDALTNEVNAAENPHPVNPNPPTPTPAPEPEPSPVTPVTPSEEPAVAVLGYERVTNPDGSQSDMVSLVVDGQSVLVADVDLDGEADLMAIDFNNNGVVDAEEITDISGQGLAMEPLIQDANPYYLADNNDYENNADVHDYMA